MSVGYPRPLTFLGVRIVDAVRFVINAALGPEELARELGDIERSQAGLIVVVAREGWGRIVVRDAGRARPPSVAIFPDHGSTEGVMQELEAAFGQKRAETWSNRPGMQYVMSGAEGEVRLIVSPLDADAIELISVSAQARAGSA
jgi:hypothetical protein